MLNKNSNSTSSFCCDNIPRQNAYNYDELIRCAHGKLLTLHNARLPCPNMLMFDRITKINDNGGKHGKGVVIAEMDVKPEQWFFGCHFVDDPVMPGCLGLDALWQMVGFFLTWSRLPGRGRALGVDEVRFIGEILPQSKLVEYRIDLKRVLKGRLNMGIADGQVLVDGKHVYTTKHLRVGLLNPSIF